MYDDYPMFQKYVEDLNGFIIKSWRLGRYNNVNMNTIETEAIGYYLDNDHPFVEVWQEQFDKELELIESDIDYLVNDLCGLLYDALRDEYEHLTSDEAVWDTIQANDLDKEVA